LILLVAVSAAGCSLTQRGRPHAVTTGASWTCAAPGSEVAQRVRTWVAGYTTPQSAKADTFRMRIQLPRVPTDAVAVVSVSRICDRAGLAYARENGQQLSPGVYEMAVVRAGDRYIVRGVTAPAPPGEWNTLSIFDTAFHLKSTILGF
jgi:hypothetical protein